MGFLVDNKINKCFDRRSSLLIINLFTDTNIHRKYTHTHTHKHYQTFQYDFSKQCPGTFIWKLWLFNCFPPIFSWSCYSKRGKLWKYFMNLILIVSLVLANHLSPSLIWWLTAFRKVLHSSQVLLNVKIISFIGNFFTCLLCLLACAHVLYPLCWGGIWERIPINYFY